MAALGGGPGAAVAASAEDLARERVGQPFKLNNIALKYIRDSNENPPGHPTTDRVDLTDFDPYQIGVLEKGTGMDYWFKPGALQPWSWRQMLAAMSGEAKEKVLGSNPPLGVVRITCEPVAGLRDHKRINAVKETGRPYGAGAQVPLWDFFVTRSDGTTVRFHTNFTNNKVEVAKVDGAHAANELPKPPNKGKGKSDGPGTYKRQTTGNYDATVRSPQTHRGGGGGSAVAKQGLGLDAPPGLNNEEPDRSDGWRGGWTNGSWPGGWQDWNYGSGWRDWGSEWQDRRTSWSDNAARHSWQ